jgi:hypothetical protein
MNKKIIGILIGMFFMIPISMVVGEPDLQDGANQPPCAPIIIDDLKTNKNLKCDCTFYSIDPDGDDIYYHIEWGDSNTESIISQDKDRYWEGPFRSGEHVTLDHEYSKRGEYEIKIIAKDRHPPDVSLESPATIVPVVISYFKIFNAEIFDLLIEKILNLFPVLSDLIDL